VWFALGITCIAVVLGGCSAVRLGYSAAPDLMYLWLDSYLDFDNAQARRVNAELKVLHRWHRSEELPLIADLLQEAQTLALQNPTGPRLCVMYDSVRDRSEALLQRALPTAASLAPGLKPEQLSALAKVYEKSNRKMREEWQDARAQGVEYRTRKSLERMEDLYGKLSAEQTQAFKEAMAQTGFDEKRYFEEVQSRQQAVLQTLERLRGADALSAQSALSDLAQRYYQSASPAYRQYHAQMTANTCVAFAKLHVQTSAEQRKHMVRILKGYENDVRALAAQKD
jgi:dihydrodipicolinate synthase/N-acetylneuraminate lyase